MASMFDQYSSALIKENPGDPDPANQPQSSGYVSVRLKKEAPIFAKQKMNLNLPAGILFLSVQNDWVIILMTNLTILRMNIKQPDRFTEVPIDKYVGGLKPTNLFLDHLGAHLLVTFAPKSPGFTPEVLYLQRNSFKPKFISKLKDQDITAVAFNYSNQSESMTGPILLGTSKGTIWEVDVGIDGGDKLVQQNIRQVFDVGTGGESRPITGIEFHMRQDQKNIHCIILVLTLDRIYTFHETIRQAESKMTYGQLQKVFNSYLNIPEQLNDFGHVVSKLHYSRLEFNYEEDFPKSFGCLTEDGINYQEIDPKMDTPKFVVQKELLPYPTQEDTQLPSENSYKMVTKSNVPVSFVLTDFHAILLYPDHVTAISLLNYQIVYEEYFVEQYGRLTNVVKDVRSNVTYVYSNKMIFRYKITNEQRNAWRLYADRQKFDLALQYCNDNPAHRDIVLVKQAQSFFDVGDFLEAARIYSSTQLSFEEVCLKFLLRNQNDALMLYLKNRLVRLKPQEKTQITMLIVWMVELYLVEISRCAGENAERERELQKEFDAFMQTAIVVDCMKKNRSVIYDLMASHGDSHNLTALTTIHQDYESVIQQYINQNRYDDALAVLRAQSRQELIYKYAPVIMEELPVEMINVLIALGKRLDPIKLIPSLLCLDSPKHVAEIVKFLEYCIHSTGCSEPAIHNYLIQLYSEHFKDKLLTFLETQGKDISMISYDVHYALRIALKNEIKDASVFLQCLLEMWVPAVELALSFDINQAKATASQPKDRNLRKKLWLIIAEEEIRSKHENVQEALKILKECDLLRIEDLLPYFSDFQKIDHFKEAICESLKEYNIKIQEQRKDMEESAKSAERVRSELQSFRNRSVTIGAQEQCAVCGVYLLLKPFFIFHCGHKFHGECLERQLLPQLSPEVVNHLMHLKQQLSVAQNQPLDTGSQTADTISSSKEYLKNQIEDILASDCLYCGDVMINTIDRTFIENWEKVDSDWQ
ncbi:vacuolar protein sorting-associated protein 18 homolog [Toxorhynchites rutilus septentrionalis]|uniref:vacuolar protein sorting-associated protein 18 homolog n=1 Tax=Toxorhynchites rutilus septentrionalis TaxID=329112 RepID=UPI002478349A|nr:vacuolar protein sorting-associated protein 18 homolog [Toxorhynchites rutilus septentrionalis]